VAALRAEGETLITDCHHIDRGYDDLVSKLQRVGADVERVAL
jgi:UDP-N-acetylglucosamine 1-carboxyvinyltransferase